MAKRKRPSALSNPRAVLVLGLTAVALFGIGQLVLFARTERGALFFARTLGIGGETRVTQIIGREIREGLKAMNVPPDSIAETRVPESRPELRWRVGLGPGASLIQTNHAIARRVEALGAAVLSGHERTENNGTRRLTLVVGLPHHPTHELSIITPKVDEENAEREPARMAIVLYGFGEDPEHAAAAFDLPVPFAAAIVPGARWSSSMFRAARNSKREIVLMLPLEPINYPNVNPGPGTVLVTMNTARITALLRKHLDQAGDATSVGNFMGSLATQDMTVMGAVFKELKRRGLTFVHMKPVPGAVCRDLAADMGIAYDEPDVMFDPADWKGDRRRLDHEWHKVLDQARQRGRLMVWMHVSPTLIDWLPKAASAKELKGVNLVPLSAVVHRATAR